MMAVFVAARGNPPRAAMYITLAVMAAAYLMAAISVVQGLRATWARSRVRAVAVLVVGAALALVSAVLGAMSEEQGWCFVGGFIGWWVLSAIGSEYLARRWPRRTSQTS